MVNWTPKLLTLTIFFCLILCQLLLILLVHFLSCLPSFFLSLLPFPSFSLLPLAFIFLSLFFFLPSFYLFFSSPFLPAFIFSSSYFCMLPLLFSLSILPYNSKSAIYCLKNYGGLDSWIRLVPDAPPPTADVTTDHTHMYDVCQSIFEMTQYCLKTNFTCMPLLYILVEQDWQKIILWTFIAALSKCYQVFVLHIERREIRWMVLKTLLRF